MNNKKLSLAMVIGTGILHWVLLLVALFVISLIYGVEEGTEMTAPPPLGFIILAIIMVAGSFIIGRWLKPASRRQAVQAGLIWSGIILLFMSVTTVANGTQGIIFGNWGVYPVFIAPAIGSLFIPIKSVASPDLKT